MKDKNKQIKHHKKELKKNSKKLKTKIRETVLTRITISQRDYLKTEAVLNGTTMSKLLETIIKSYRKQTRT